MFECRCEGDREGLRVQVRHGRVMHICSSCRGWWMEAYTAPVTRAPQLIPLPTLKKRMIIRRMAS